MAEHTPLYYAKGVEVFKSPVRTKRGDKTNITMGFSVCIVSDFVEADDVASMLIAAEGHDALVKENAALRAFVEGFHITVCENFYKDVSLTLEKPHSLSLRIAVDSSKSWLFADLETRRVAALATAEPTGVAASHVLAPESDAQSLETREVQS